MPGPLPKDPKMRQRRNRESTAATLSLVATEDFEVPALPPLYRERPVKDENEDAGTAFLEVEWHPRTVAWWETVWSSPMAPEWLKADWEGLFLLAELEDDFHRASTPRDRIEILKEIRLQRAEFGLTPIARRRLQWEVARGEEAAESTRKRRTPRPAPTKAEEGDPLAALQP